ncbi:hypothetical protein Tco_0388964 [Tanacetum coccineum]
MAELLLEAKLPHALQALCEKLNKYVQEKQEEKNIAEEPATKIGSQYWKPPIFYDDDDNDDEESSIPLRDIIFEHPLSVAIAPDLPITDSLIMEDGHLNTISETESDEEIISIDSLLEEFSSKLAHIDLIPPGIDEADCDLEEIFRLVEKFDSLMEEIDIFLAPDDSIPPGIENNDYDSEGDVLFLEELLNNDSIPKYESFHVDFYNVPLSPRPPEKPPDDDGYLDIEPDTGVLIKNVVDDIL